MTITADASDNVGVTQVEFYVDGTLECTDTTAPFGCEWTVPAPPWRVYEIQAIASNAAENSGSSSIVTVTSVHSAGPGRNN